MSGGDGRRGRWSPGVIVPLVVAGAVSVLVGAAGLLLWFPGTGIAEIGWKLVSGWWRFPVRVSGEVEVNGAMVASGFVGGVLAAWMVHVVFSWFVRDWAGRQTLAVLSVVAALFGSALCGVGCVRQFGWLGDGPVLVNDGAGRLKTERLQLEALFSGVRSYAEERGGRYPPTLAALAEEMGGERFSELALAGAREGGVVEPVVYYGAGLELGAAGEWIVLATGRPGFRKGRERVVATSDGEVRTMDEAEFRERAGRQVEMLGR